MIRNFLNLVRNQFLGAVKILRIDNVTEFFQRECHDLLDYLGMIHQSSCSYTPQQNG